MDSNKNNSNNSNSKEINIADNIENTTNQKDNVSILVNIILLALIRLKLREQGTTQETEYKIEQQDNLSNTIKPCLKDK